MRKPASSLKMPCLAPCASWQSHQCMTLAGCHAGGERAQVGIVHNWMPYEAKRSRLGIAGRLVWWPSALMRMADHCCERPTSKHMCWPSSYFSWSWALGGLARFCVRVWGLNVWTESVVCMEAVMQPASCVHAHTRAAGLNPIAKIL